MKRLLLSITTLSLLLTAFPAHAQLSSGTTAYWKLDESSGNAADATGNSRTLTNTNTVTYVAGLINNAAHLVGASSQKLSRTDLSGTTAGGNISISLWVKPNSQPATNITYALADVASSATSPYVSYIFSYRDSGGTKQIDCNRQRQAVSNNDVTSNQTLTTGTYYHLVCTYDGANITIYLNGSQIAQAAESGNGAGPNDANDETVIGAYHSSQGNFATADIDEVGIWNRALSSSEVTSLYNSGTGMQYPFGSTAAAVVGAFINLFGDW